MKRLIVIMAALLTLASVSSPATSAEKDKVSFVLDWIIYGRHTPYFVAVEKGIFAKYDIDAKVERGYGLVAGLRRLGAGQADFLFADFGGLILARGKEGLRAKMSASAPRTTKRSSISTERQSRHCRIWSANASPSHSTLAALFLDFSVPTAWIQPPSDWSMSTFRPSMPFGKAVR